MNVCIVIATKGRPEVLRETLGVLRQQTLQPLHTIVSCVSDADLGTSPLSENVRALTGPAGLAAQRNTALRALSPEIDIVVFFDDDFIPHCRWIEEVERHFAANPDVSCITGNVLADGINGPGIGLEQSLAALVDAPVEASRVDRRPYSPYGCNMAFRISAIAGLSFDERLVLYGWQEDRDFGALAARRGAAVQLRSAFGVHRGVKGGRVSGAKFGYSQIANVAYLYRKGTVSAAVALWLMSKNFLANAGRSLWPEKYVDRIGRLRGNVLAIWDMARGCIEPEKAARI